jgi:hypothetical protein
MNKEKRIALLNLIEQKKRSHTTSKFGVIAGGVLTLLCLLTFWPIAIIFGIMTLVAIIEVGSIGNKISELEIQVLD